MPSPKAATTVRKTPNFDFLFGRYGHSACIVPYFQVSMSLNDAAQYLRLVNELPGSASMSWRIEELFQRDIDWPRVERKIVPYLKSQEQPQFFNALTIALLPIHDNAMGSFAVGETWNPPHLDSESQFIAGTVQHFGPISCGYWSKWDDPAEDGARIGQLCWNTDQVCGVAIDGQHRLAAIKQLVGSGSDVYRKSHVPVILVLMHPHLGFNRPCTRDSLIDMMRRLFIDLNKHARTVNRARQILLDDRDPASICVRTVVGSELVSGLDELTQLHPRLPLALIDWHSEQAKFDVGPYLTTILGLDWAVANIIGIRPFEDPMAFDEIERLIDRLEHKLDITLGEARERLKDCRRFERPFSFQEEPVNDLSRIADGFRQKWCHPLVHLLTEFQPYRSLIDLRSRLSTLCPEFANWFALKSSASQSSGGGKASHLLDEFEAHLANRDVDPIAIGDLRDAVEACQDIKSGSLAFTVVFQRAVILAFLQLTKISGFNSSEEESEEFDIEDHAGGDNSIEDEDGEVDDAVVDEAGEANFAVDKERAEQLIAALNHVITEEPDFLLSAYEFRWDDDGERNDRFWLCSIAQPEGPIDFTQGASKRASELLVLIGIFWLYRSYEGFEADDFDELIEKSNQATTGLDLKFQQCLNRMWAAPHSIGGRIVNAREDDVENGDLRWEEIRGRASWLWNIVSR